MILAEKEGRKKEFTETAWDMLPEDKCGWRETVAIPEDVKPIVEKSTKKGAAAKLPETPVAPVEPAQGDDPEIPAEQ